MHMLIIFHPLLVQVRRSIMPSSICENRPLDFRLKTAVLLFTLACFLTRLHFQLTSC